MAPNPPPQELTIHATLEALEPISEFITGAAHAAGLDEHAAWQVQLAVDEAATNIIQHGYPQGEVGRIALRWQVERGIFVVALHDWGRGFNPSEVPRPDLTSPLEERQAGGLGIYLMNRLMDTVSFVFDPQRGNTLTMTKRVGSADPPPTMISLSGRLDAVHTQAATGRVSAEIAAGALQVLIDMAGVSFLSSSGLRALLLVRRDLLARGGELRLCALQPQVEEVFTLTGFTQVFAIHRTREEALAAFLPR